MFGKDLAGSRDDLVPGSFGRLRNCHEVGGDKDAGYARQLQQFLRHCVVGWLTGHKGRGPAHGLADAELDRVGVGG